jgi:hypothetical protein
MGTRPPQQSNSTLGIERRKSQQAGALLDDLSAFIGRYLVLSQAQSDVSALWVAHTHAVDAAEFTPYLHISSPVLRSGKTLLLKILRMLVAKPWFTGRVTSAVLVRKTHAQHPTLLLDESDTAFTAGGDYAETLRGVLNTGFERTGTYSMCNRNGDWYPQDFSTFSPKAIAGIGRLPDTVEDRSIPIKLKRKLPTEACERFREKLVRPVADQLRVRLSRWAKANLKKLRAASPSLPEELNDRQQDVCEPLVAIADLAGEEWPMRAKRALLELCTGQVNSDESTGTLLLRDIRSWFAKDRSDRAQTQSLLGYLNSLEESPWAEFKAGRKLTPQGLAKLLRGFDIRPRDIRFGLGIQKGYLRSEFEEAWKRYLSPNGKVNALKGQQAQHSNIHAGFKGSHLGQQKQAVATLPTAKNTVNSRGVAGVALLNRFARPEE